MFLKYLLTRHRSSSNVT